MRAVDVKRDLVFAHAHFHVALHSDEAREFVHAFRRDDEIDFLAARTLGKPINKVHSEIIGIDFSLS